MHSSRGSETSSTVRPESDDTRREGMFANNESSCINFLTPSFTYAFAIDRIPGPVCFSWKFSSANLAP